MSQMIQRLGELPVLLDNVGSTITTRIKRNLNGRILHRRSGTLYDSWGWITEVAKAGWMVTVASDVAYARIHDLGGWTGANHATFIPARRYVSIAFVESKQAIIKLAKNFLVKIVKD